MVLPWEATAVAAAAMARNNCRIIFGLRIFALIGLLGKISESFSDFYVNRSFFVSYNTRYDLPVRSVVSLVCVHCQLPQHCGGSFCAILNAFAKQNKIKADSSGSRTESRQQRVQVLVVHNVRSYKFRVLGKDSLQKALKNTLRDSCSDLCKY